MSWLLLSSLFLGGLVSKKYPYKLNYVWMAKKFLEWPKGGVKNISDLGNYIKNYWWKLAIFIIILIVVIWVIVKILKLIISLIKGN